MRYAREYTNAGKEFGILLRESDSMCIAKRNCYKQRYLA